MSMTISGPPWEVAIPPAASGGSGAGIESEEFEAAAASSVVVTAPGTLSGGSLYGENVAVVRLLGSTGSYSQSGHVVDGVLPPIRQATGAEVLLSRYTVDGGATWHIAGVQPGDSIGTWAWADLPSAVTYDGCLASVTGVLVDTDGAGATRAVNMIAAGGRWRYETGQALLRSLTGPQTPHSGTSETAVGSAITFPLGLLAVGDMLEVWLAQDKVGDNGVGNIALRIGDQGDATDAAILSNATAPSPNTSNSYAFGPLWIRFESATSARLLGNGGNLWNGTNAGNVSAAVTIDSITAAAARMRLGNSVANAADTISATTFHVIHHMAG